MNFAYPDDTPPDTFAPPTDDEIREQLARIRSSPAFDAPERAQKFLCYIIEETLAGRADRIKAYSIAIEVFGRDASFDAQNDPVVRIEAGRVRRALEHYYLLAGQRDPILITIPKGGYVPAFTRFHELTPSVSSPVRRTASILAGRGERLVLLSSIGLLAGILVWNAVDGAMQRRFPGRAPGVADNAVPGMPRVVINSFEDITGTQDSALLARGLTDEVIGQMARFKEITVLAGDPSGAAAATPAAGSSVPFYGLEGGVRLAGNRVRFSARLVDRSSRAILWTKSYDAELDERQLLDIETEIASDVATALAQPYGVIFQANASDVMTVPARNTEAYACALSYYGYRADLNRQTHTAVQSCLKKVVADYPGYSTAWALLSLTYLDELRFRYRLDPAGAPPIDLAVEAAERATELDPGNVRALQAEMLADYFSGDVRNALAIGERAYAINPNDTEFTAEYGFRLALSGQWERGCGLIADSLQRNPGSMEYFQAAMAVCAYMDGNYQDAERWARTSSLRDNPIYHLILIAIYGQRGKLVEAQLERAWLDLNAPEYLEDIRREVTTRILRAEDQDRFIDGLRKAGLNVPAEALPRAEGLVPEEPLTRG